MPIERRKGKWWWGSKGPFDSRQKAEDVAQAAHASGYEEGALEKFLDLQKYWRDPKARRDNRLGTSPTDKLRRRQDNYSELTRMRDRVSSLESEEDWRKREGQADRLSEVEQPGKDAAKEQRAVGMQQTAASRAEDASDESYDAAIAGEKATKEAKDAITATELAEKETAKEARRLARVGIVNQNPMERQQQGESLKPPPESGLEQFVKFQKNYATTSSTGSSTGGPSYFNATYGGSDPAPKKKFLNATYDVAKGFDVPHEQTMFTSIETADKAFNKPGRSTKEKSHVDRVNDFLGDNSPEMASLKYEKAYGESHSGLVTVSPGENAANERRKKVEDEDEEGDRRRELNTGKGGGGSRSTSGKTMSTTPDHSHVTTLLGKTTLVGKNEADVIINSAFTTDLIKWVIEQSRLEKAGADQYGTRTLPNELPYNPRRGGDYNIKEENEEGSPTTETTMPAQEVQYANMGQAGGFEAGIATHDPAGAENPANMTDTRLPDKGRHIGKNQGGAYLASANQGGMNMQGMEKGVAGTGGGTPHVFGIVTPMHGGEAEQTKPYIEGKSDLDKNNPPDVVEERSREKRRRDEKDAEPGMDGPGTDDAGAAIASIGNPITQLMEKQGFEYEIDALHRGGSLAEDQDEELPTDEEGIEQTIRQQELQSLKQFAKMMMEEDFTIGKTYGL